MASQVFNKDSDATADYTLDWSDWLASGDSISSYTVTVESGLTLVSDANDSSTVTVTLSGGTVNTRYLVTVEITTSDGLVDERTITIKVVELRRAAGSSVGQVIDRLYREWLTPANEQEGLAQLDGSLTDSATSVTISTDMVSPDEVNHVSPGSVIEVGLEQMLVISYNPTTKVATVKRGYNGTTAAAHSDDDLVTMRPKFARKVVFDAVADEIVSLHPALWGYSELSTTGSDEPIEVDSDVIGIAEITWMGDDNRPFSARGRLLRNYPPFNSGRALLLETVPDNKTTYCVLKKEFPRPTSESDNLCIDLNVEAQWEQIVIVGAASRLSSYVDPTKLDFDWATEFDQHQGNPTGTGTVLARRLQSIRNDRLQEASRRQKMEHPPITTYTNPFYSSAIT